MRTTIDLPDDLHGLTRAIARDEGCTLSQTVVGLLRRALGQAPALDTAIDPKSGLPSVHLGRPITSDDVRSLEDEQ
ncbi:MAG TPA: antitoxin [Mycobacteriales bacterium]|nr:antitoxin [Mycobacteriales bacterium]